MDSDDEAELKQLRQAKQYGGRKEAGNVGAARGAIKRGRQKSESEDEYVVEQEEDDEATLAMKQHLPMTFGKVVIKQNKGDTKFNFEDEDTFSAIHAEQARKKDSAKATAGSIQIGRKGGISTKRQKEVEVPDAKKIGAIEAGEDKEDDDGDEEDDPSVGSWKKKQKTDDRKGLDIADDDDLPVTHEVRIPSWERKAMTAIALDAAGSRMVTGSQFGPYKFYDFAGMNETKKHFREMDPVGIVRVEAISFCPSGGHAVFCSADCQARVYDRDGSVRDAATRHYKRQDKNMLNMTIKGDMYVRMLEHTKGHSQIIVDAMWNPLDNQKFITSSLDGSIRKWDLEGETAGMDKHLCSVAVLKCLDRRNQCIGGVTGAQTGGLYPVCAVYNHDTKKICGGCSDGSLQFFYEKPRMLKPDKILRTAHNGMVTGVAFLRRPAGEFLVSRGMDETLKLWDVRMLSDQKGPVKSVGGLPNEHDKTGVCASPDFRYVVTCTSAKGDKKKGIIDTNGTVKVFDSTNLEQKKSIDIGPMSPLKPLWHKLLNQIVVSTDAGEAVMLYNPQRSKKGALYFVGRKAKGPKTDSGAIHGPIFNISHAEGWKGYNDVADGTMQSMRKVQAKYNVKDMLPERPEAIGSDMQIINGQRLALNETPSIITQTILAHMGGKNRLRTEDSQKALHKFSFADDAPELVGHAYAGNPQPLDWTQDESEAATMLKGDFCRKCGQKVCKCVDYTIRPITRHDGTKGYFRIRQDGTKIPNRELPKPMSSTGQGITREKRMDEIEQDIMSGRMQEDDDAGFKT